MNRMDMREQIIQKDMEIRALRELLQAALERIVRMESGGKIHPPFQVSALIPEDTL